MCIERNKIQMLDENERNNNDEEIVFEEKCDLWVGFVWTLLFCCPGSLVIFSRPHEQAIWWREEAGSYGDGAG